MPRVYTGIVPVKWFVIIGHVNRSFYLLTRTAAVFELDMRVVPLHSWQCLYRKRVFADWVERTNTCQNTCNHLYGLHSETTVLFCLLTHTIPAFAIVAGNQYGLLRVKFSKWAESSIVESVPRLSCATLSFSITHELIYCGHSALLLSYAWCDTAELILWWAH